ncbi:oxidoreductase [Gemmobacter lanyuensis]
MRHFLSAVFAAAVAATLTIGSAAAETGETVLTLTGPGLPDGASPMTWPRSRPCRRSNSPQPPSGPMPRRNFRGAVEGAAGCGGVDGSLIRATALNDYAVEIPRDSLEDGAPILATRINGEHFSRRDKGPLWVVYPYDSAERFRNELIFGRSVWQLNRVSVE